MIIVRKHNFGLIAIQKWFPNYINIIDCLRITMYKQVNLQIKSSFLFYNEKSYTLHSNLTLNEEEILKKFSSTIRNEIKRSQKEGVIFTYNEKETIFLNIYNHFASQKGISCLTINNLHCYGSNIILTSVSKDNIILAVHSYLIDSKLKIVRLLHSATQRFSDDLDKNMIARSNKYLHFMDIQKFKNEGFKIYDWGGIAFDTQNNSLQGINKFKESFGGDLIEQKNLYSPLYFIIMKLFK